MPDAAPVIKQVLPRSRAAGSIREEFIIASQSR
jgi:hypothetical protein